VYGLSLEGYGRNSAGPSGHSRGAKMVVGPFEMEASDLGPKLGGELGFWRTLVRKQMLFMHSLGCSDFPGEPKNVLRIHKPKTYSYWCHCLSVSLDRSCHGLIELCDESALNYLMPQNIGIWIHANVVNVSA
jgi:hypothetical protein